MAEVQSVSAEKGEGGRRTLWIVLAVILILLCACCLAFLYLAWTYGDSVLETLSGGIWASV